MTIRGLEGYGLSVAGHSAGRERLGTLDEAGGVRRHAGRASARRPSQAPRLQPGSVCAPAMPATQNRLEARGSRAPRLPRPSTVGSRRYGRLARSMGPVAFAGSIGNWSNAASLDHARRTKRSGPMAGRPERRKQRGMAPAPRSRLSVLFRSPPRRRSLARGSDQGAIVAEAVAMPPPSPVSRCLHPDWRTTRRRGE